MAESEAESEGTRQGGKGTSLDLSLPRSSAVQQQADASEDPCAAREVIVRAETLDKTSVKLLITLSRVYLFFASAALAVDLGFKGGEPNNYLLTVSHVEIWNIVYACVCLVPCLHALGVFSWRLWSVRRRGLKWTRRRRNLSLLGFAVTTAMAVNLLAWLAQNAWVLSKQCAWFDHTVFALNILQWSCYNTIFAFALIQVHNVKPVQKGKTVDAEDPFAGEEPCVGDMPWAIHLPKLLLWIVFEAILISTGVYIVRDNVVGARLPYRGDPSCKMYVADCSFDGVSTGLTSTVFGLFLCYVLIWTYYFATAQARLRQRSYQKNRVLNVALQVQKRTRAWSFGFFAITLILLFFWRPNACSTYLLSWLGLAPAQLLLSGLAINGAWWLMPCDPCHDQPVLQEWLESFAWMEADKARLKRERDLRSPDSVALAAEPVFCFETASKLFYWSCMTYYFKEEDVKEGSVDPADYTLKAAMRLYGLDQYQVLWETELDTKVLLSWGSGRIVAAWRGTDSWANVLTDLKMWTSSVDEVRRNAMDFNLLSRVKLGRAATHSGFLKSWQANGFKARFLQRVHELVASFEGDVDIYLTGHSLGGALATLAANDLAADLPARARLHLYTYGSPRTGNHAFARQFREAVKDCWDIINDQDAISRNGKWLRLYKRPGHRVIINERGDMIVRPSFAEASYQRVQFGSSLSHHMLASYQRSLAQICAAQFRGKGFPGADRKIAGLLGQGALQVALGPFADLLHVPKKVARTSVQAHSDAVNYLEHRSTHQEEQDNFKLVLDGDLAEVVTDVSRLHEASGRLKGPETAEARDSDVEEETQGAVLEQAGGHQDFEPDPSQREQQN